MAVMEIKKAGDKILKEIAASVVKCDKKVKKLLNDMAETMYQAEGVGLAAPQVGISLRIVVIDTGEGLLELINPAIIAAAGNECGIEGCLSVPGMCGEVERATQVTVEYLDRNGKKNKIEGTELLARALQHEIDHLDGVLFIEKAKTLQKGS